MVLVTLTCAAPARAYDVSSPYGVVAFIPSEARFDAMQDADIAWGRYDFSWRSVEGAGKGLYDWSAQDYAVAQANARGMHIYAGLGYTPSWASVAGNGNSPPINNQDWYDYVYATVSRYKDSIKYWELWNEPDLGHFWGGTKAEFIELFKIGADAAHAADPDCMVLGPEVSSAGGSIGWMVDLLQQAGNRIDIITFHQYGGEPAERLASIDLMHDFIENSGYGNKPIWVTESGWASDTIGEQTQADHLTGILAGMASRPWWKKFFYYQIWEGATDRAGLLRQDESRKPAWFAYRDFTAANPTRETVSVNLSTTDIEDGVNLVTVGDGNTTPTTIARGASRRNTDAAGGDYYMYFNVDDDFAFEGNLPIVAIDVDYYDLGTGTLTLQYDSIGDGLSAFYKSAGSVTLGNMDTWKQHTFYLIDAYFGNRQNNGADFRFSAGVGTTFYLDMVQVRESEIILKPGDFNTDGTVDAADYVMWRKRVGIPRTLANYNRWRTNFGSSIFTNAGAPPVPEPGSLLAVVMGTTMLIVGGRNGASRAAKQGGIRRAIVGGNAAERERFASRPRGMLLKC
jgi:hypothetical protein